MRDGFPEVKLGILYGLQTGRITPERGTKALLLLATCDQDDLVRDEVAGVDRLDDVRALIDAE